MISQLITQLNNMTTLEKYQQDKFGCLLDFSYFEKNYRLIAADLSKPKVLDADSRAIQQIIFTGKTSQASVVYYIYEKLKETTL